MGLSGIAYLKSRFGVMNIVEILIQVGLVVIACVTGRDTKVPEASIFASFVSLMTVVVMFLFHILRKSHWETDCYAAVCTCYILMCIFHCVCWLWLTGEFVGRMSSTNGIPADIAALIMVSAFFHLCSSTLFGVDAWMRRPLAASR